MTLPQLGKWTTSSMQIVSRKASAHKVWGTGYSIVYWVSLDSSWQPFEQWLLGNVSQIVNNNSKGSVLLFSVNTDSPLFLEKRKKEKIFLPEGIRGSLIKDTCKQNKWQKIFIIFNNREPLYKAGLLQTQINQKPFTIQLKRFN